ncbi:MAG: energy-coupling factor ABC transporter ATP-binding protein [Thermoplasmata archaeon]
MVAAIEVQGLSFRYQTSSTWALDNVDFRVSAGQVVLVTGPTGSGKSTLLRAINGLLLDFYEGEARGVARVLGNDVLSLRPNRVATFVGTVFQSPEDQIVASRVRRDVAFGLENLGLPRDVIDERVDEALEAMGLGDLKDREVVELSGGEMQRLALASIIAMRPRILLLDEPASELDPRGRQEILRAVEGLARSSERTVVLTDHRLADVLRIVDRLVVLDQGRVAFDGPPKEVMARPELDGLGIEIPTPIQVWRHLALGGIDGPCPLTSEDLLEELIRYGRTRPDGLETTA